MSGSRPAPGPGSVARVRVRAVAGGEDVERTDLLAVEEPLELRVVVEQGGRRRRHAIAVTMRTPGHDFELAAGFLYGEGALAGPAAVAGIAYCRSAVAEEARNIVEVTLAPGAAFDPARFSRNVYTTSSCGVCGRASLEAVRASLPAAVGGRRRPGRWSTARRCTPCRPGWAAPRRSLPPPAVCTPRRCSMPAAPSSWCARMSAGTTRSTRSSARCLLDGRLPASDRLLLVSGRASFELVQKAVVAGLPVLAAVGAPSSLAVELAREHGLTLIGFLRDGRFNVYSGEERLKPAVLAG